MQQAKSNGRKAAAENNKLAKAKFKTMKDTKDKNRKKRVEAAAAREKERQEQQG